MLLGENGSGKSTLVRALATVLMGSENAMHPAGLVELAARRGAQGSVEVQIKHHADDKWVKQGNTSSRTILARAEISRNGDLAEADEASSAKINFRALGTPTGQYGEKVTVGFPPPSDPSAVLAAATPSIDGCISAIHDSRPLVGPRRACRVRRILALVERATDARPGGDEKAGLTKDAVVDFINGASCCRTKLVLQK